MEKSMQGYGSMEEKEKIFKKEKYLQKKKRKNDLKKGITRKKTNCRVDKNIENYNISFKIVLDSIAREVKKRIIASWI